MHCLPYHQYHAVIQCIPKDYSADLSDEINKILWSSLEIWVGNKQSRFFFLSLPTQISNKVFSSKNVTSTEYQLLTPEMYTEQHVYRALLPLFYTERWGTDSIKAVFRSGPFSAEWRREPRFLTVRLMLKLLWSLSLLLCMTGRTMQHAVWKAGDPHLLQNLFLSPSAAVTNSWLTQYERVFPNDMF